MTGIPNDYGLDLSHTNKGILPDQLDLPNELLVDKVYPDRNAKWNLL